jgi:purine-binding chemotaxis protein CheW
VILAVTAILFFSAGGIRGGLPLAAARFVERMAELLPAPESRPGAAGAISLHGEIIPVYSLAELFGSSGHSPQVSDILIIADTCTGTVALWVDEVYGTEEHASPGAGDATAPGTGCITMVTTDNALLICDIDTFLSRTGVPLPEGSTHGPGTPPGGWRQDHGIADRTGDGDVARARALLARQARKLAGHPDYARAVDLFEVIRFRLMYREYALETKYVREVIMSREITPVPGTPEYISGICAVRGEIISLVDLRALFGLHDTGLTDLNRVIIISDNRVTFGILVDYISGIGAIPVHMVSTKDTDGTGIAPQFIRGIVGDSLIFLDCAAILSDPRMIIG